MNKLSKLLQDLGAEVGLELVYALKEGDGEAEVEIRFEALPRNRSFSLNLSRSWRTTRIAFVPDSFAQEMLNVLIEQSIARSSFVADQLEKAQHQFSLVSFEADRSIADARGGDLMGGSFLFEVESLTSKSAINRGLVNESEERMIAFVVRFLSSLLPFEVNRFSSPDEVVGYPEGAMSQVYVNRYERDPRNRSAAIELHGYACSVCDFNFENSYGPLGAGYVVIHHVTPVSQLGPDYELDPSRDLVALCANCHAMVHRTDPPLSITELRDMLLRRQRTSSIPDTVHK